MKLNRIAPFLALIALPIFALSNPVAKAEAQPLGGCLPNPNPYADPRVPAKICATGVGTAAMDAAFQFQQTPVWCWAASMAMILAFSNEPVSQQDIVSENFGSDVPASLPPWRVGPYLNHTYTNSGTEQTAKTRGTMLYRASYSPSMSALIAIVHELSQGHPLLIFTPTHAMVMTAIYYYANNNGNPVGVQGVIVRDPFPYTGTLQPIPGIPIYGHPGERVLSPREYFSTQYVFLVSVS